jgi:hypothetical protein
MTANRIELDQPLVDGRQSEMAIRVWRGAARLLRARGFACVGELTLASGRRADLAALGPGGEIWIVEVKSSLADLRADDKWPDYRAHCVLREAPEHKLAGARRKALTLRIAQSAAQRLYAAELSGIELPE